MFKLKLLLYFKSWITGVEKKQFDFRALFQSLWGLSCIPKVLVFK